MKINQLKFYLGFFLLLLLAGCNSGAVNHSELVANQSNSAPLKNTNKFDENNAVKLITPFSVGGTYDSMSGNATTTTSCLTAGSDSKNTVIINPQATLDFSQSQNIQQVANALGISLSIQIGVGPFALHTGYAYAHSSENDNYSTNINYVYRYTGTAEFDPTILVQGESALTPDAKSVLFSPTEFRTKCGDSFIAQINAGASVLFRLTLTFNSSVSKNYFDSSFSQISGLSNVLSIIQSNPNNANIQYNLTAAAIQVGGDPQQLTNLFESYGGHVNDDGYPELNCGTNVAINSNCLALTQKVIDYAKTLSTQLNAPTDYYFSNPTLASWGSIGVIAGDVTPESQIQNAMQELSTQYNADENSSVFLKKYTNELTNEGFLSSTMQESLQQLSSDYQQVLDIYQNPDNHVMDCFNGFVSSDCLAVRNNILSQRNAILSDANLNSLLTYLRQNQFTSELVKNESGTQYANCLLHPITSGSEALFAIDCDGQVSGSLSPITGISIIPFTNDSLLVNNLNYVYLNNKFTYQIAKPLYLYGSYLDSYGGFANILLNAQQVISDKSVFLSKLPNL